MTVVDTLLESISEPELRAAVLELRDLRSTGILRDGIGRIYSARLHSEIGVPLNDLRSLVENEVYRIAALKWAEPQPATLGARVLE